MAHARGGNEIGDWNAFLWRERQSRPEERSWTVVGVRMEIRAVVAARGL
jgi:hypothetical protein